MRSTIILGKLRGKVVWITGASSGLGKALALELAKYDVKLCISARHVERLQAVKAECLSVSQSLDFDDILVLQMDVTDIDSQERCFDKVIKHFGRINVLVNSASRLHQASFEEIDLLLDRELFELDVFSVVNLTYLYLNHGKGRGHVVVTSSFDALLAMPECASHTAAKRAICVSIAYVYNLCIHIAMPFEF